MSERIELGCAGHLIVSSRCKYRRHTQILGPRLFRVSTVGDFYATGDEKRTTIGGGDDHFFESMVFETTATPEKDNEGCGCLQVADYGGLTCRRYATAGEAHRGHEELVAKYMKVSDAMWEETEKEQR